MGEFSINTANVEKCVVRFNMIQGVLQQQASVVENVLSGLDGIGLGDIVSNLEGIREQLSRHENITGDFSETLEKIVRRYIYSEENILGNGVSTGPENVIRTSNTGDPSIDDFWNDDEYFCEGWYKDHDKFIEAYKKMIEELKDGRISLEDLYQNKYMVELLQYLFGAEVDGSVNEYTFNMLELFTDDFAENGYSFGLYDFLSFGAIPANQKWDFILSLVHDEIPYFNAQAAFYNNIGIENGWSSLDTSNGVNGLICVDGVHTYICDQEGSALAGMYSNVNNQNQTSAAETFCENVAIYNAMEFYNPGNHESLSEIVQYNSTNGNTMGLNGMFYEPGGWGVDPFTIASTLEHYGYTADELPVSAADAITPDVEPVVIVSALNSEGDITHGIHTYCLTVNENGQYVAHNSYGIAEGSGEQDTFASVGEFVNYVNGNYKPEDHIEVINIVGVR